jgi:biotin transporter BioY
MPMLRNSRNERLNERHLLLVSAFLLLVILGAKVDLDLGGVVSFTLQTLFLGIGYCYLPVRWRLLLIGVYLILGILGLPVFNKDVGWEYFSSWPLGFFLGFLLAAFIPAPTSHYFSPLFKYFIELHGVILVLGAIWYGLFTGSAIAALETTLDILPGVIIKSFLGSFLIILIRKYLVQRDI